MRLDDALLREVKREAAERGETLTALIEKGLRLVLAKGAPRPIEAVDLPVSKAGGGTLPGVDLDNTADLLDLMDRQG